MKVRSSERVARINELELKHQSNVNQMELTGRDEEARLLKLRLLTLRDENASLKDRLVQRDALVKQLSKQSSDTQAELKTSKSKLKAQDTQIRKQGNALEDLKTEIDSLNEFRQDSNKVLQEKLALSRKLDQVQPELEHLQSQLENHRAIVAQKQDLERQLSSVEVELENEKRSNQRIQSKNQNNDEWKEQFDEAKGEMEKLKKEYSRELREVRGEYEMLEGRMEDTRSKLKKTQTDLKDARAELASCRAELEEARKMITNNKLNKKNAVVKEQLVGKRRAHDISMEDISIGTPGPDETTLRRPLKKRGAEQALVGEKSTFSITPFLNRSKNITDSLSDELSEVHSPTGKSANGTEPVAPLEEGIVEAGDSLSTEAIDEASGSDGQADGHVSAEEIEEPEAQKGRGRLRKALDEAPTTKKNMPVQAKKKAKATKVPGKLAAVSEEVEIGEVVAEPSARPKKMPGLLKSNPAPPLPRHGVDDADARKKKRKVLGGGNKTLFDDDEAEPTPNPAKIQMGAGRKLKAPLGGPRSAFGGATFSPLKKDRRGVNASFLH
ncbi:hypothetical protein FLAG1_03753 [Fusarium langsethiae]|uniref:Rossmann-fold nad (+)-binding protein n=1 Tax=Fusarium langsethiae TaxID=179993 RepID=A0A0N0V7F0_FUSLA|nr:hypothetical protein FLAG1_03753 [Fusarium langsethiae]GKU01564.1 unnamed protein product [Fusarium langsethiae]GKU19531.1 unnamed protein product [Fusarium langsethiae]